MFRCGLSPVCVGLSTVMLFLMRDIAGARESLHVRYLICWCRSLCKGTAKHVLLGG